MKRLFVLLLLVAGLAGITSCTTPNKAARHSDLVILISIDGFRWDYLQKYDAPHLKELAAGGVHARRMTPSFPSLTFPNHYTLVTGLYPGHHGIVANNFYDPDLKATFAYKTHESSVDPRWWSGGEPVWITAEKQGVRSACFFWPGSEAENHGMHPSFYKTFEKKLTCTERVDGLIEWLSLPPEQRTRFAMLYFDIVDTKGHDFGPAAPETGAAVLEADTAIGRLLDGLTRLGLRDKTDLVIVSDHGMEPVSADRTILLDDYAPMSSFTVDFAGPVAALRPKTETPEQLAAHFRGKHPELNVWLRNEVPERLHYRASNRIAPVILSASPGWYITNRDYLRAKRLTFEHGTHGFDPASPNMGALFVANGPSFKHGYEFADVENIHVYNLLCAVLGITPAPNDGDNRLVREAVAH
ncbi:MAG TPA: nucleotide pyrophosphatase/phosphodiesterase family protein [Candidatus Didemnitutus sp.]|nr:nucleotide pyrophosphatase/phosphodiesterase family protein [Candidatus Didemnitutus sp.]